MRVEMIDCGESDNMIEIRGSLSKFPDVLRMGTYIDSTHMKL